MSLQRLWRQPVLCDRRKLPEFGIFLTLKRAPQKDSVPAEQEPTGTSRTLLSATCSPLQTTSPASVQAPVGALWMNSAARRGGREHDGTSARPASVQAPVGALWVNSAARREGREHGTSAQHPPLPGQVNLTQWKVSHGKPTFTQTDAQTHKMLPDLGVNLARTDVFTDSACCSDAEAAMLVTSRLALELKPKALLQDCHARHIQTRPGVEA
ncbi:hypothetical protein Anapl_00003 [Anas platyrhynchos]|uniref:Uncharacterized protein n=1 Tax=Anas platyrhynchos TaxID=8839 RepID=R0LPX9_ANAPL|nr:hypothetical protein Anapl_00003 [Anas platyrhynchos]